MGTAGIPACPSVSPDALITFATLPVFSFLFYPVDIPSFCLQDSGSQKRQFPAPDLPLWMLLAGGLGIGFSTDPPGIFATVGPVCFEPH